MELKDEIPFGVALPYRSFDPVAVPLLIEIAQRAENLGYQDLWVAENTIGYPPSLDGLSLLTYVSAVTSTIGLGIAVVVLPLHSPLEMAHRVGTLDYLSGGRAILGVGIGAVTHYPAFGIPIEHRVTRFRESIELIKKLWTDEYVTFDGRIYSVEHTMVGPRPIQQPHPPIWLGGDHPDNLRRAATLAQGWMGSGASSTARFAESTAILRNELEMAGRDPATFPISKRLWMFVDEDPARARAEVDRWLGALYGSSNAVDEFGVWGTPAQVGEQIAALIESGANHLLLNPVSHHREQIEVIAEMVGLTAA